MNTKTAKCIRLAARGLRAPEANLKRAWYALPASERATARVALADLARVVRAKREHIDVASTHRLAARVATALTHRASMPRIAREQWAAFDRRQAKAEGRAKRRHRLAQISAPGAAA